MEEVGSVRPNPYIFEIENRRKRKPRLAHDLGAGARCKKCEDKCPGFELHFWRKICQNCRCGKDDHEVEDEDEDIGQVVIGKLFERPARTKKEELEYSYGNNLDIVNEETGKAEKLKFDWVPPNIGKNLAARYMAQLPQSKRPVAGSEAAKDRKKQLEQQLPLYDMDEAHRCDNMPAEELQSFMEYLDRIKTNVAGQGVVQEIIAAPTKLVAQPLSSSQLPPKPTSQATVGGINTGFGPGNESALDNQALLTKALGHADDNELYSRPYGQSRVPADQRKCGLQEFMGEMIQDYHNMNLANSEPYGVTPGASQPLKGLGGYLGAGRGDTAGLGLEKGTLQQMGSPAKFVLSSSSVPGQYGGEIQPYVGQKQNSALPESSDFGSKILSSEYGTPGNKIIPPEYNVQGSKTLPPEYNVPGSKTLPPEYNVLDNKTLPPEYNVPSNTTLPPEYNILGNTTLPPEYNVPGNTTLPPEYNVLGNTTLPPEYNIAGSETLPPAYNIALSTTLPPDYYFPSNSDTNISADYHIPSNNNLPYDYSVPGGTNPPGAYKGSVPSLQDHASDWNNSMPGKQHPSLGYTGPVPYNKQDPILSLDSNMRNQPTILTEQQPYIPGRETTIHGYQSGGSEPANLLAQQEAGNLNISNKGNTEESGDEREKQPSLVSLTPLSARTPSTSAIAAVQAPYGAQLDTMKGGMMMAPGSDVSVLFPDESQVLGGPGGRTGTVPAQHSKFSCQYCSLPLNVGDVAVFCERAGPDKCWHPACFSCFTCHELLADLIYFYQDGKVYCGRHFTQAAQIPRCTACDELIFGNSWTRADGFDWHLHHFCCYMCDTALAGQRYVPDKEGCPYCLPCYMAYLAKMCEACEEKILPEESRCGHRGYFYHGNQQCFACHTCNTPLIGKKFKMSKNWVFCSNECIQAVAVELQNNPNPKEKV